MGDWFPMFGAKKVVLSSKFLMPPGDCSWMPTPQFLNYVAYAYFGAVYEAKLFDRRLLCL